jgi:two-component system, sensor histidine kinase and response regulator
MAKILLVEDDEAIRESLTDVLDQHKVVAVSNGVQALEVLETDTTFDLILLDLFMPLMHGCAFRREQAMRPAISRIPVVMISAARPQCHPLYRTRGFLNKPFEIDDLMRTIEKQLKKGPLTDLELTEGPDICRTCPATRD